MNNKPKYLKDNFANMIFSDENLQDYTIMFISKAIGVNEEDLKKDFRIITPRIEDNEKVIGGMADQVFANDKFIVNVEVNYSKSKNILIKNMRYIYHFELKQMPKDIKGIKNKYEWLSSRIMPVFQININYFDMYNQKEFYYKTYLMDDKYHNKREFTPYIIDINVEKLNEMDYNLIEKGSLEYTLYVFSKHPKGMIKRLYGDDEIMKKVLGKLENLENSFDEELYYDKDELLKSVSFELGEEQGIQKGKLQEKLEIVKNMLKKKLDKKTISEYTGLSIEEIEEIIKVK